MKKNTTKSYAKALVEVLSRPASVKTTAWQGKITENFVKILVLAGLEKKAKEILDLAENILLAKQGKKRITFETARKTNAGQKKILEGIAETGDIINEKIKPELIAGVKIIINDSKQFDASMQSKLQKIIL